MFKWSKWPWRRSGRARAITDALVMFATIGSLVHNILPALAFAPSLTEIDQYLIIGMRGAAAGAALTVGSSQELGANRQTLSGGNPGDAYVSTLIPGISPESPAPSSPNLRSTFFKDQGAPTDTTKNRCGRGLADRADRALVARSDRRPDHGLARPIYLAACGAQSRRAGRRVAHDSPSDKAVVMRRRIQSIQE